MPKKANAGAASDATRTSAASEERERESVSVDLRCEREEWREVYLDEVINNEERVSEWCVVQSTFAKPEAPP